MIELSARVMPAQIEQLNTPLHTMARLEQDAALGAANTGLSPQQDARLRQSCQDFEALFLSQMFKVMRQTVEKNEMFAGGQGEHLFQQMHDEAVAEHAARTKSLGLSEMMYRQLIRGVQACGT